MTLSREQHFFRELRLERTCFTVNKNDKGCVPCNHQWSCQLHDAWSSRQQCHQQHEASVALPHLSESKSPPACLPSRAFLCTRDREREVAPIEGRRLRTRFESNDLLFHFTWTHWHCSCQAVNHPTIYVTGFQKILKWKWKQQVIPKRLCLSNTSHDVTYQKTVMLFEGMPTRGPPNCITRHVAIF